MSRKYRYGVALVPLAIAIGCGRSQRPAAPQDPFKAIGIAPLPVEALAGTSVLILPVGALVLSDSAAESPDLVARRFALAVEAGAALDSAFRHGAPSVKWLGLAEQRRALHMAPALGIDPARLETGYLIDPHQESMVDPLWGELRELTALVDARTAVAPAGVRLDRVAGGYVAEYVLVMVDPRSGRVLGRGRTVGPVSATPDAALASGAAATIPPPTIR